MFTESFTRSLLVCIVMLCAVALGACAPTAPESPTAPATATPAPCVVVVAQIFEQFEETALWLRVELTDPPQVGYVRGVSFAHAAAIAGTSVRVRPIAQGVYEFCR